MERRKFLGNLGMGAAALGSAAALPDEVLTAGLSGGADRNSFRAADFGAVGNGVADDTAAIQRAIDAAYKLGGGTVYLEGSLGRDFRCAGQLSLDEKRGVRIIGNAGPNVQGFVGVTNAQLNYTGTASPFISMRSSVSVTMETTTIAYDNVAFVGSLIETGHGAKARADASYLVFDRCRFMGRGRANSAEYLLNLSLSICSTVRNCEFQAANIGVVGSPAKGIYSNVIQITDSAFRDLNKVAIRSAGESWLISGCTFEPLISGRAGAYYQGKDTLAYGLNIIGCWMGDVSKPGGCWIDITAAPALGLTIIGNRMGPAGTDQRDTAIKIGKGNQGVTIAGNRIEGPIGIDFTTGYTFGASITGNDLQSTTPIANLTNAMNHFVAGQYQTPNYLSGISNFQIGIFSGDAVRGSINLAPQTWGPPTKPQNGDIWTTDAGMFVRINGVTKKVVLT